MKHLAIGLLLALAATAGQAETVRVGIKSAPPFVIAGTDDSWTGISVALWEDMARQLDWKTHWVVLDSPRAQIEALAAGDIDVAIGALSVTQEREALINFSHSFFSTGLAIAAPVRSSSWVGVIKQLISRPFLRAIGLLIFVLLAVGALLWLVEHRRNPDQFGGSVPEGIGSGFWWSAVTMTTVGYGDKAPITVTGRLLATIWMFVSVITISGFTAGIASSLTTQQLSTDIRGVQDLAHVRSLAVAGSIGEDFLRRSGISALVVASPDEGLSQLRNGEAGALIHDEPLLRYLLRDAEPGIEILPQSVEPQFYAFGIKPGFEHTEMLNRALLSHISNPRWQETLNRYLGTR